MLNITGFANIRESEELTDAYRYCFWFSVGFRYYAVESGGKGLAGMF
jgi:hypothetical protein